MTFVFLQKSRKEDGGQSGGEEEPEEENHTPLPPPMQIIKDPNNPEVQREELWYVIRKLLLNITFKYTKIIRFKKAQDENREIF